MTDVESQQDEITALKSIFTEEEFTSTILEDGSHSGQFYAYIQLPSDFYLMFMKAEKLADCHQIALQHLPPIELSFQLPQDYPSLSPPVFTLSCPWISPANLFKFCSCLDKLWDENKGQEIIYIWAQFLKEESLQFLKIERCLDISHIYESELRRANARCRVKNVGKNCIAGGDGEAPSVNNTDLSVGSNEQKGDEKQVKSEFFIEPRSAITDRRVELTEKCVSGDNKYDRREETPLGSDWSAETHDETIAKNCGAVCNVVSKSAREGTNWGNVDEPASNKPEVSNNVLPERYFQDRKGRYKKNEIVASQDINYENTRQAERDKINNRSPDEAGNTATDITIRRSKTYYSSRVKTNSSINGCQNNSGSNSSTRFVAKLDVRSLCERNIHDREMQYTVSVNRRCDEICVLNARNLLDVKTRTMGTAKINNGSQVLLCEEVENAQNAACKGSMYKQNKNYSDGPKIKMSVNSNQDDFDPNWSTNYVVKNGLSNRSEGIMEKQYQKPGNESMSNKLFAMSTKMVCDIKYENPRDVDRSATNNDAPVMKFEEFGNTYSRAGNRNTYKPNYEKHNFSNRHKRNSAFHSRNDVAATNEGDARPDLRNVYQGNNQDTSKQYQRLGNGNSVHNKPLAMKATCDVEKNIINYDVQRSHDGKEIGTDSSAVTCIKKYSKYKFANLNKSTASSNSRKYVSGPNGPTGFVLKHNVSSAENVKEKFVGNENKYSQEWTPEKMQKKKRKEFRNQHKDNLDRQFDNGQSRSNHKNPINIVNNSCDCNESENVNSEYTLQQTNAVVNTKHSRDSTSNNEGGEMLSNVFGQLKPNESVVKNVNNVADEKEPQNLMNFTFQKSNQNPSPIQDATSNEKGNKIRINAFENVRLVSQSFPNGSCSTLGRLASQKQKINKKKGAVSLRIFRVPLNNVPLHRFLESYNRDRAKTEFLRGTHSCIICFEDMPGTKCTQFSPCGHTFCRDCVTGYLTVQINEGAVQSIGCLALKCTSTLTPHQVRELVGPELFARYDSLLLTATLQSLSDIIYCPRPQCQYPTTLEPDATMAVCPSCQYVFCVFCKMVYHGIEPCRFRTEEKKALIQEYQHASAKRKREMESRYGRKQLSNLVETYMSENWIDENSKNCPHCNAAIEKSDGCNKMVCWRCNTFFCWLCMEQLSATTPYQHYYSRSSKCHNLLFEGANWTEEEEEQGNQREQDYYIPEFGRNGIE